MPKQLVEENEEQWQYAGWTECQQADKCNEVWKCGGYAYEYYDKDHPKTFFTRCCVTTPTGFDVDVPRGMVFDHWCYCKFMEMEDDTECGEHCHCLGRMAVSEIDSGMTLKICPRDAFDDDINPTSIVVSPEMIDTAIEEDYDSEVENIDDGEQELSYPTSEDFADSDAEMDAFMSEGESAQKPYKFMRWDTCIPVASCGWGAGLCLHRASLICFDRLNGVKVVLCEHEVRHQDIEGFEPYDVYMDTHHACGYSGMSTINERLATLRRPTTPYKAPPRKLKVVFFERSNPTPDITPLEA